MGRDFIHLQGQRDQETPRGPGLLERGGFFDRLIHGRKDQSSRVEQRQQMPESRVAEKSHESSRRQVDSKPPAEPQVSAADKVRAYFKQVERAHTSSSWRSMSSDEKYDAAIRHLTKTGQVDDFRASIVERNTGVRPAGNEARVATMTAKMGGNILFSSKTSEAYSMSPDGTLTQEAVAHRVGVLGAPLVTSVKGFPGNDGLSGSELRVLGLRLSRKGDQTGDMYSVDRAVSKGMKISIAGIGDASFRRAAAERDEPAGCCGGSSPAQSLDPKEQVRTFYRETRAGYSASAWAKLSDEKKFEAVEAKYGKAFVDAVRNRDAAARRAN